MTFVRAYVLGTILIYLPPPNPAHVVFEEFGTMAGSVSYLHLTLHINLTHVENLLQEYIITAKVAQDNIDKLYQHAKARHNTSSAGFISNLNRNQIMAIQTIYSYIQAAEDLGTSLDNVRGILPTDQKYHPGRSIYRESRNLKMKITSQITDTILSQLNRKGINLPTNLLRTISKAGKVTKVIRGLSPASMGFSLLKGIFGTFMGLYNVFQMEKLRRELRGVIQTQNKVIEVLEDHQQQLDNLRQDLLEIQTQTLVYDVVELPRLQSQLTRNLVILKAALRQVIHAVQQAHHHRLAIDYFEPDTLNDLYETIQQQAKANKYKLLTKYPSDLFQLEASYMFDGKDVMLFLHVPMVPEDSLLTLYKLKPFPIPFSETMALLPRPTSSLLALSNRIPRAMTHIDHADLVDCHQVNQVYLCERHGVLQNQIKSSCLGALFEQDIPSAQQVCDLELVPYTESVLQLKNNWFLIYSPVMYTAYLKCLNDSTDARPIQVGVQQVFVDPSCHMELKNHSLTSELSMKLDAEVTYFPWKLADLTAFSITEQDIKAALEVRTTAGERNIYLAEVLQHKHFTSRIPPWSLVLGGLIVTSVLVLAIWIISIVGTQRIFAFRRRMRRIREAVNNIGNIPLPRSRRPSVNLPLQPPPVYPGLSDEPGDSYELVNLNPDRVSAKFQRLSRAASRLSNSSLFRSKSLSRSGHLRHRFADRPSSIGHDAASDTEVNYGTCKDLSRPTPKPRAKTPSYMFLKATA